MIKLNIRLELVLSKTLFVVTTLLGAIEDCRNVLHKYLFNALKNILFLLAGTHCSPPPNGTFMPSRFLGCSSMFILLGVTMLRSSCSGGLPYTLSSTFPEVPPLDIFSSESSHKSTKTGRKNQRTPILGTFFSDAAIAWRSNKPTNDKCTIRPCKWHLPHLQRSEFCPYNLQLTSHLQN